jgi:conjugative relaxase-like TrwC/TraI family protein
MAMLSVGKQYEKFEYYAKDPVYNEKDGQFLGGLAQELGFTEMNAETMQKLQAGQAAAGVELEIKGRDEGDRTATVAMISYAKVISEKLGIDAPQTADFESVRNFLDKYSDTQLGYEKSDSQQVIQTAGAGGKEHNPGKDFTFTPDKSLSLARFSENAPDWFKVAHDKAMLAGSSEFLKTAVSEGMITYRTTENGKQIHHAITDVNQLAGYTFLQTQSRANDFNSHAHNTIFNMAKVDNEFKAVKFDKIYTKDGRAMLGQAANNAYYRDMKESFAAKGLNIDDYMTQDKTTGVLSLKGYSDETLQSLSTRSEQINAELKKKGIERTGKSTQVANLETRPDKEINTTKAEMDKLAAERSGGAYEKESAKIFNGINKEIEIYGLSEKDAREIYEHDKQNKKQDLKSELSRTVGAQIEALSKNEIFQNINTLVKEVLKENPNFSAQDVRKEIESRQDIQFRTVLDRKGTEVVQFATNENVQAEKEVQSFIENGKDKGFAIDNDKINKGIADFEKANKFNLSDEQKNAINAVFSKDQTAIVQGFAGTGKTTLFDAVKYIADANGIKVIGLSNDGAAAEILQKETGIKSQTVKSFIAEHSNKTEHQFKEEPTLFVWDEASKLGVIDARDFLTATKSYDNFNLRATGDIKQLKSISAGNVLENALKTDVAKAVLSDIRRQKGENVQALKGIALDYYKELYNPDRKGNINGAKIVDKLQDKGYIRAVDTTKENIKDVVMAQYKEWDKKGKTTGVVTRTIKDKDLYNQAIRDHKIVTKQVTGKAHNVDTYLKINMNESNRTRSENYKVGGVIAFKDGEYKEISKVNHKENSISYRALIAVKQDKNVRIDEKAGQVYINGKAYGLKSVNENKTVTFLGAEQKLNLNAEGKDKTEKIDRIQKYEHRNTELKKGDQIIFTQKVKGIAAEKETIKHTVGNKTFMEQYKALSGQRGGLKGLVRAAIRPLAGSIDARQKEKEIAKAIAEAEKKGEKYNEWKIGNTHGVTIQHMQTIENNTKAEFIGKNGDIYNFKLGEEKGKKGTIISLDVKNEKDLQALKSIDHGYAKVVDRWQGDKADNIIGVGLSQMDANGNMVTPTRAVENYIAVVDAKDLERVDGKESNLDRAFSNENKKTSIYDGKEIKPEQDKTSSIKKPEQEQQTEQKTAPEKHKAGHKAGGTIITDVINQKRENKEKQNEQSRNTSSDKAGHVSRQTKEQSGYDESYDRGRSR